MTCLQDMVELNENEVSWNCCSSEIKATWNFCETYPMWTSVHVECRSEVNNRGPYANFWDNYDGCTKKYINKL